MKWLRGEPFDRLRDTSEEVVRYFGGAGDHTCGMFRLRGGLIVIASTGGGWDHVSVSRRGQCPSWEEMVYVKRMFFEPDEWAFELHPPPSANISVHEHCLHLWRPNDGREIPLPPEVMVA